MRLVHYPGRRPRRIIGCVGSALDLAWGETNGPNLHTDDVRKMKSGGGGAQLDETVATHTK